MSKYKVTVNYSGYNVSLMTVLVDAETEEEAKKLAFGNEGEIVDWLTDRSKKKPSIDRVELVK